eukprot:1312-Hanusia_phi.AAC.1
MMISPATDRAPGSPRSSPPGPGPALRGSASVMARPRALSLSDGEYAGSGASDCQDSGWQLCAVRHRANEPTEYI